MEISNFITVFILVFTFIIIFWISYNYYKLIKNTNDKLEILDDQVDYLEIKLIRLGDRIDNMAHNEEGIGSINPSEADTE